MKIHCPNCDQGFNVNPEFVGKKARCNKCTQVFRVPSSPFDGIEPQLQLIDEPKPLGGRVVFDQATGMQVRPVITRPATSRVTRLILGFVFAAVVFGMGTTFDATAPSAKEPHKVLGWFTFVVFVVTTFGRLWHIEWLVRKVVRQ